MCEFNLLVTVSDKVSEIKISSYRAPYKVTETP